jgi:bifunctional DNA-binding transcriptional regulator/antitoxin component of YhaV-PrlF toxin-antitoxin module
MTITVNKKTALVVPPSVQRLAGIRNGDRLEFKVSTRTITIVPAKPSAEKLTRSELAAIRKGQAAISRGESVSLDDFLNGLDRHHRKAGAKTGRKVSR